VGVGDVVVAQQDVLVVSGLKQLLKASKDAGTATNREVRAALRQSGEIVRDDAARRLSHYSAKSAAGLKVRVRQRGIAVEQSLRKTTGPRARANYGSLQMRKALLPALNENEVAVEAEMEKALDKIVLIFDE
jgi:hypothetical protein